MRQEAGPHQTQVCGQVDPGGLGTQKSGTATSVVYELPSPRQPEQMCRDPSWAGPRQAGKGDSQAWQAGGRVQQVVVVAA